MSVERQDHDKPGIDNHRAHRGLELIVRVVGSLIFDEIGSITPFAEVVIIGHHFDHQSVAPRGQGTGEFARRGVAFDESASRAAKSAKPNRRALRPRAAKSPK